MEVVLERSPSQKQLVVRLEQSQIPRKETFVVLQAVSAHFKMLLVSLNLSLDSQITPKCDFPSQERFLRFIDNDVLPVKLPEFVSAEIDSFIGSQADIELLWDEDVVDDVVSLVLR